MGRALHQGSMCIWHEGLMFKMEGRSCTDVKVGLLEIQLTPNLPAIQAYLTSSEEVWDQVGSVGGGDGTATQLPLAPSSQQQFVMDELSHHVPVIVKVLGGTGELSLSVPADLSASPPSSCPLCSRWKPAVILIPSAQYIVAFPSPCKGCHPFLHTARNTDPPSSCSHHMDT